MSEPVTLATFNADFAATKQFKAVFDPAPMQGKPFKIAIYAQDDYTITSLYGSVTFDEKKPAEKKREIISLNSEPSYPVKQIISKRAATAIVNTLTEEVILAANESIPEDFDTEKDGLIGSVEWVYLTFSAQIFTHAEVDKAGEYVLFAKDSNDCTQLISFSISEDSGESIKIAAYPLRYSSIGFAGLYANFIVFPPIDGLVVKPDVGTVSRYGIVDYFIEREQISFSGKEASAAYFIAEKIFFTGLFFDGYGNVINPSFTVTDGVLIASAECWGTGYLTYATNGVVYDYFAEVENPPGGGIIINQGHQATAFAFNPKQKGISASYAIPDPLTGKSSREDMIIVYRELILQGERGVFEMPDGTTPAWPDGNDYINYPTALVDEKPEIGEPFAPEQEDRHIVFVTAGVMNDDLLPPYWHAPTGGSEFLGVKWKIRDFIPAEPNDKYSQSLIDALNARKAELIEEYEIV
jgi:hypothetical protein